MAGKVCSMNAQQFIDEEEDLDTSGGGLADETGANGMAGGGWFTKVMRRNTQVTPDQGKVTKVRRHNTQVTPDQGKGHQGQATQHAGHS